MANEGKSINKVVYGDKVLIDLTADSVTSDKLLKDVTAHDKSGTNIIGTVDGQEKTVQPNTAEQIVLPDEEYQFLSKVTVTAIPYVESENAAGGITVAIAG